MAIDFEPEAPQIDFEPIQIDFEPEAPVAGGAARIAQMAAATRDTLGVVGRAIAATDIAQIGADTDTLTLPAPETGVATDEFGRPVDPRGLNPAGPNPAAPTRLTGSEGLAPLLTPLVPLREAFSQGAQLSYLASQQPPGTAREALAVAGGIVSGAEDVIGGGMEFLTSPVGLATLGLGAAPAALRSIASATFAADMASHAPEALREFQTAPDAAGKARALTKGLGTLALTGLAGAHAYGQAVTAIREARPTLPQVAPLTAEAVAKTTAAPLQETAPTLTPLTTEAARAATEKGPSAIQIQESTASLLRPEGPQPEQQLGLPRVGETYAQPQEVARAPAPTTPISSQAGTLAETGRVPLTPAPTLTAAASESGTRPQIGAPLAVEPVAQSTPIAKVISEQPLTTGIKNAAVDAERQSRGQEPILAPQRIANPVVWDSAMARIEREPGWQDRLVEELKEKPRTPSAEEIVGLDHRYVDLQNEYAKAVREGEQAFQNGNTEGLAEAKTKTGFYEGKLAELEQVARAVGTEWGRSGQMRQRLMREDFSLAAMEARVRAAKGFEPLTEAEHATIRTLHEKLAAAEARAIEVEAAANHRILMLEAQKAAAEAPRVLAAAERFASFMDKKGEEALGRIRERLTRTSAGIDPTVLADVGILGAAKITRGVVDFAQWTDAMVRDLGEWFREHAREGWSASQATLERERQAFGPKPRPVPIDKKTASARGEVELLRDQFKKQLAKHEYSKKSRAAKIWLGTKEALNLSRALLTSWDVSAVFRQGGFVGLGNPARAARALGPMFEALVSERRAAAIEQQIRARPNANLYEQSKLFLAPRDSGKLIGMEEAFMSRLASQIPGVAASQRAYITFLNKLRADTFDALHESLTARRAATPEELSAIANYINVATGRGNLGKAAAAAETLATVFFSPRLVASRFQLILGQPAFRGSAATRYLIAKEYAKFLMGIATVYGLGQLAGATVETDSRSSDFGKLKFGNTRVDPLSGLSQTTVLISRLTTGERTTLKGVTEPIRGKVPYGKATAADVIATFLRTKLSPVVGSGVDIATGKNVVGEPVTAESVAINAVVPLAFRDILDVMEEQGILRGTALGILSLFGVGVQNYEAQKTR